MQGLRDLAQVSRALLLLALHLLGGLLDLVDSVYRFLKYVVPTDLLEHQIQVPNQRLRGLLSSRHLALQLTILIVQKLRYVFECTCLYHFPVDEACLFVFLHLRRGFL